MINKERKRFSGRKRWLHKAASVKQGLHNLVRVSSNRKKPQAGPDWTGPGSRQNRRIKHFSVGICVVYSEFLKVTDLPACLCITANVLWKNGLQKVCIIKQQWEAEEEACRLELLLLLLLLVPILLSSSGPQQLLTHCCPPTSVTSH